MFPSDVCWDINLIWLQIEREMKSKVHFPNSLQVRLSDSFCLGIWIYCNHLILRCRSGVGYLWVLGYWRWLKSHCIFEASKLIISFLLASRTVNLPWPGGSVGWKIVPCTHTKNCCRFSPWSGYMPRTQDACLSPSRAHIGGNNRSLSPSLKINKHILRWRLKRE